MNIRLANKFDQPAIFQMLRNFRMQTPIKNMRDCDNEDHISRLYHAILVGGGVAIIAERDEKPIGMILGLLEQSIWDPNMFILKELCYWVEPEYRGSSAGYRLLKAYIAEAQKLKDEGRIAFWTMTLMTTSPDLHFDKFGFNKVEETWVSGI